MKIVKRKTKVINLKTKEEIEHESRFAACKSVGIERKALNGYMKKGTVFQRKYKFIDLYTGIRCSECNEVMSEGYKLHDGIYHYCSDECLHKNISKEDYEKIYDMGFAFWTTFED